MANAKDNALRDKDAKAVDEMLALVLAWEKDMGRMPSTLELMMLMEAKASVDLDNDTGGAHTRRVSE